MNTRDLDDKIREALHGEDEAAWESGGERGVIGVYGPWFGEFDRAQREQFEGMVAPVVVAVPSGFMIETDEARRARLAGLLQRAIGYHITFEERE